MAYVILWVESLTTSLLWAAALAALAARVRAAWGRGLLPIVCGPIPVAWYILLAIPIGRVWVSIGDLRWLFISVLALPVCYVAGAIWIARRGRRRVDGGPPAAASWRLVRLAAILAGAGLLHAATVWCLDLAARRQLIALRAQAAAICLAVAPARVPDGDNAAILYRQAFGLLFHGGDQPAGWDPNWNRRRWWSAPWRDANADDAVKARGFLARHAVARRLLRQAGAKRDCYFDANYADPSRYRTARELGLFVSAGELLELSAAERLAAGDIREAMADVGTSFAMVEHAGDQWDVFRAAAAEGMAVRMLQMVLADRHVPAEALACVRIDSSVSHRRQFQRSRGFWEGFRLAAIADLGFGTLDVTDDGIWEMRNCVPVLHRLFMLEDDLEANKRRTDEDRKLADMPYHLSRKAQDAPSTGSSRHPRGVFTAAVSNRHGVSLEDIAASADAVRSAARVGLLAARYRADHGKLPDTPQDLVGESLPVWPTDPFDGKPLRWKRTGKDLVIYSVGGDLKDDGGTPHDSGKQADDIVFRLGG